MTVFVLLTMCNHTLTEWRPFIVSSSSLPWKWHCMHTTCWCKSIDFILRLLFSLHNILIQKHFLLFKLCRSVSSWKEPVWIEKEMFCKKNSCKDDRSNAAPNVVSILQKKTTKVPFFLETTQMCEIAWINHLFTCLFFHRPNSSSYHSDKTSIKNTIRFTTLSNFVYTLFTCCLYHTRNVCGGYNCNLASHRSFRTQLCDCANN